MKTVMVIDDDPDDLELMKEVFDLVSPRLLCASFLYADEALELLLRGEIIRPDWIFLDLVMSRLDGASFLKRLRKLPEFDDITVIIYSTHLPTSEAELLLKMGAAFTFEKPHSLAEYKHIIKSILITKGPLDPVQL